MAPYFSQLETYYAGIEAGTPEALQTANSFNGGVKANYSPASYILNALLPSDSGERKLDIVATVLFTE